MLGDIWSPEQRGTALVFYAFSVVGGPTIGPIVGGAVVQSYLRWRWTQYVRDYIASSSKIPTYDKKFTGIYMMTLLILDILILDETYPPALLVAKARRLRHETGNWALHAKHEEWDVSFKQMAVKFGVRPFQLLMTPICLFVAMYASFVYGIVYLMLAAVPIQFAEERGWGPVTSELPFLGIFLGAILGGLANIFNNKFYTRKYKANGNKAVPEARLPPMMVGSVFFASGMFIFGWCSHPSTFWLAPVIGLVCLGFGFFTIFQAGKSNSMCFRSLVDTNDSAQLPHRLLFDIRSKRSCSKHILKECLCSCFPTVFVVGSVEKMGCIYADYHPAQCSTIWVYQSHRPSLAV